MRDDLRLISIPTERGLVEALGQDRVSVDRYLSREEGSGLNRPAGDLANPLGAVTQDSRSRKNEVTYLNILEDVLVHGNYAPDRTGTGSLRLFNRSAEYDLRFGFPLLTTKTVSMKFISEELFWFLNGDTNVRSLQQKGVTIWDEWAREDGSLGPVYGHQWRNFNSQGIDQIKNLIDGIIDDPFGRRHIVSAWNPAQISEMALPPCHSFFQIHVEDHECDPSQSIGGDALRQQADVVEEERYRHLHVSMSLYQRSGDMFLGVPYNIASYSLLLMLICTYLRHEVKKRTFDTSEEKFDKDSFFYDKVVDFHAKSLHHTIGDCHIYSNHMDQVKEQLSRTPHSASQLVINDTVLKRNAHQGLYLRGLDSDCFSFYGYNPQPAIKAPVAV